jgi:putative membrane protein insertion efficiency factor
MTRRFVLALLGLYQRWISPALHSLFPSSGCKFHPTCSHYAVEAITLHGAARGGSMALRRLVRCHPFSSGGFDPVPLPADCPHPAAATVTLGDPLP